MSDMLERLIELNRKKHMVEDDISKVSGNERVKLLLNIPGINVYSAAAIMSEIDDIRRFSNKEKLASYAGVVPRQSESESRDQRGHISKYGPSMLRFILVNAAHMVIKHSKKMEVKYLRLVRRRVKNRAIVAIARFLTRTTWTMLSRSVAFYDEIDSLTEIKMDSMPSGSLHANMKINVKDAIKLIENQRMRAMSDQCFSLKDAT